MTKDSLLFNKIAAAILVAGLVAMGSGFIADLLYHPQQLAENAYPVATDGVEAATDAVAAAPAGPEPITDLLASADIAKGEKVARKCTSCHAFEKGGPNKTGPVLWNVVGADKGHAEGFGYSGALMDTGGAWDYDALNHFLWKPKDYISGTKMNFAGLRKAQDRADIIAWMREQADSPIPLP